MAGSSVPCCSPFKHGCICTVFSCSLVFSIRKCHLSLGLLWLPGLYQRLSMPWPVVLCATRRESSFGCHLLISLCLRAEKRGALLIMILTPATAHALIVCCKWPDPFWVCIKMLTVAFFSTPGEGFYAASGGFPGFPGCWSRVEFQMTGFQCLLFP